MLKYVDEEMGNAFFFFGGGWMVDLETVVGELVLVRCETELFKANRDRHWTGMEKN